MMSFSLHSHNNIAICQAVKEETAVHVKGIQQDKATSQCKPSSFFTNVVTAQIDSI